MPYYKKDHDARLMNPHVLTEGPKTSSKFIGLD